MTQTVPTQLPTEWRDFFALTKPRVMSLVIFTGLCGLLAAPGHINPVLGFTAILCIALGAGGAAALNQWWEADIDAGMKRTAARPLPAGRMTRTDARDFGDQDVIMEIRYYVENPKQMRPSKSFFVTEILRRFGEEKVTLAFPVRINMNSDVELSDLGF